MKINLKKIYSRALSMALAGILAGCASLGTKSGETEIRSGVIEQVTDVQISSNHHRGLGAVVGGVAGLGLGSMIGGGSGHDVAMVAGAVGGALAGNAVQKKHDKPIPGQQIIVRTTSGVLVSVTQPADPELSVGQSVYISGNGEGAQVQPQ